jgi:hypothetical protein
MTKTTLPSTPTGVPAWLTRLTAALVAIVPSVLAWVDPGSKLPHGAIQACVILAGLLVGGAIGLVHLIHSDVHEYGWSMNAVTHMDTEAEAEIKTLWPEFKQTYETAKPALEAIPGVQGTLDAVTADVAALKAKEQATGLDPAAIVAALEQATGMTFPRAAAPAVVDPAAVTGQAS